MACLDPYRMGENIYMCRKCADCQKAWKRAWLGRLMAQHYTSYATWFVTLTYGGGDENMAASCLTIEHLEQMFKTLRAQGYKFQPITVGEYGEKNGRAHWHVLIFWENEPPDVDMNVRMTWQFTDKRGIVRPVWRHGYAQCELPKSTQGTIAYILDYLQKKNGERGEYSFPKRPAVGEKYLIEFAREKARTGTALFPRNKPIYQVPGNVKDRGPSAGQLYDYWIDTQSVIFDRMIIAYLQEWALNWPKRLAPYDKFVHAWVEDLNGHDRADLVPDPVRQHVSTVEKLVRLRAGQQISLAFSATLEDDVVLVECLKTGAAELRHYDDEGVLRWRKSVKTGVDPLSKAVQRQSVPHGVYPGDIRPGHRSGVWHDPSIRPSRRER